MRPEIVKEGKLGFWQLRAIRRGDFDSWDAKAVDTYWTETMPVTGVRDLAKLIASWYWATVLVFVAVVYIVVRVQHG